MSYPLTSHVPLPAGRESREDKYEHKSLIKTAIDGVKYEGSLALT